MSIPFLWKTAQEDHGHVLMVQNVNGQQEHCDPYTGEEVRLMPRLPCLLCIGYPCECGTAGQGC